MVVALRRNVQGVLLVLVGSAVLRIAVDGTFVRYVKEGMRPYLLGAGAVLLALGVVEVALHTVRALREEPERPEHGPPVAWLLLLPVLGIFLVAPPALGSYMASRDRGVVAAPTESDFPPLPATQVVDLPVSEYVIRATYGGAADLDGRTFRLTGFVTPGDAGAWYLTRIVLVCCAADGLAYKIEARGGPAPPADTWIEVIGRPAGWAGETPALHIEQLTEVPAPENPYE